MIKRKFKKWKASEGGSALLFTFIFLPMIFRLIQIIFDTSSLGIILFFMLSLLFIGGLVWMFGIRPLFSKQLWKIRKTWYEALFGVTVIITFFSLFLLVTGSLPTNKYSFTDVDRSYSLNLLMFAMIPLFFGFIVYYWEIIRKIGTK